MFSIEYAVPILVEGELPPGARANGGKRNGGVFCQNFEIFWSHPLATHIPLVGFTHQKEACYAVIHAKMRGQFYVA